MSDLVQAALARMDRDDHEQYVEELRRAERRQRKSMRRLERLSLRDFDRSDPGHPLGRGYPEGHTFRDDGESHREAWMRIIRRDPCSYCGKPVAGTLDHIEPRSLPSSSIGGVHSWLNYTAACEACNSRKGQKPMLRWMLARRGARVFSKRELRPIAAPTPHVPEFPCSDRWWIKQQFRRSEAA